MKQNFKSILKLLLMCLFMMMLSTVTFKLLPSSVFTNFNIFHPHLKGVKIDWYNYEKIRMDQAKTGFGEHGVPVHVSEVEKHLEEDLFKVNGFNAFLSDKISVERSIPDIRNPGCKNKNYTAELPNVSIIVAFHDEHWSTLLRTVHSVINRTPSHLIKEIILVDDFSSKDFLKEKLDNYVQINLNKVQVIHLQKKQGSVLARLAGAKMATGDVLLFLDSHTEVNVNWLPPLLEPIAVDYKTCVCPLIDIIAYDTFAYRAHDEGARGVFNWEFSYKRLPLLPEDMKHPTEPFRNPVMAGEIYAISAQWFWELGGYDEGFDLWGGEKFELSFKIWQCGGQMFNAPCSRVGHVYKKFLVSPKPGPGELVGKNNVRVAEVWMDEYKEYLYDRKPHYRQINIGDLTAQKNIRGKLNCKPFKWFMKEVAFDIPKAFPPTEPENFASGEIRSVAAPHLCVDTKKYNGNIRFGVSLCMIDPNVDRTMQDEQLFQLGWMKDIRPKGRNMCWDVVTPYDKAPLVLFNCHGYGGNQLWRYKPVEKWLVHGSNSRCLDLDVKDKSIYVTRCDENSMTQKWKIEHVNIMQLEKWDNAKDKVDL